MTDRCQVPRCRRPSTIIYLDKEICDHHLEQMNTVEGTNRVRKKLKLPLLVVPPRPAARERPRRQLRRQPVRAAQGPLGDPDQHDKSGNLGEKWWK